MSTLDLSPNLTLPPEFMTLTSAALGLRGSGKTNTGVVCTEALLELKQQVIVIDPLDVWWGLKSSEDGKAPGFPIVVLGGTHADLPMGAGDGVAVADFLAESRTPAILSLRHISKNKQRQFVADFAEQLYQRKGEPGLNTPVLVVVDEASMFVPQSFQGDAARCVGAIEDLVRRGRASGLGVMLIDQRAASVNKDVLTQLEILFAHRTTSPQDRNALKAWVQAHDTGNSEGAFMESLASLGRGEAWVWSPGVLDVFERVQVRKRRTFDSSATPPLGQAVLVPDVVAPIDLEPLRERLAETIEEAQKSDPRALKIAFNRLEKENAQLRRELEERPLETVVQEKIVEKPVLSPEARTELQEQVNAMFGVMKDFMGVLHGINATLGGLREEEHEDTAAPPPAAPEPPTVKVTAPPAPAPARKPPVKNSPAAREAIHKTKQRLLDTLAQYDAMGINPVAKLNLAASSGLSGNSGSYEKHLRELREDAFIYYPKPNHVALTDKGQDQANPPSIPLTLRDLHAAWSARLKPTQAAILGLLIGAYPRSLTREAIANELGLSSNSGSFEAHIRALVTEGIAHKPQTKHVAATALLFPDGLS